MCRPRALTGWEDAEGQAIIEAGMIAGVDLVGVEELHFPSVACRDVVYERVKGMA